MGFISARSSRWRAWSAVLRSSVWPRPARTPSVPPNRGSGCRDPYLGNGPPCRGRDDAGRGQRRVPALAGAHADRREALDELEFAIALLDCIDQVLDLKVAVEVDEILAVRVGIERQGQAGEGELRSVPASAGLQPIVSQRSEGGTRGPAAIGQHRRATRTARYRTCEMDPGRSSARETRWLASSQPSLPPAWHGRLPSGYLADRCRQQIAIDPALPDPHPGKVAAALRFLDAAAQSLRSGLPGQLLKFFALRQLAEQNDGGERHPGVEEVFRDRQRSGGCRP